MLWHILNNGICEPFLRDSTQSAYEDLRQCTNDHAGTYVVHGLFLQ